MYKRVKTLLNAAGRIGAANTFRYVWLTKFESRFHRTDGPSSDYELGKLYSRNLQYPVYFRRDSSDIAVFWQIFILDEYQGISSRTAKFIIDCGANVGYSSAYFLSRFPNAFVIAIEPDERNFELLRKNLLPYGNRVKLVKSAVWSNMTGLKINDQPKGNSMEWATAVSEVGEGEIADIFAVDIGTILNESGHDLIDILKIDIEGAEEEVFQRNFHDWLSRTRVIAIELHGAKRRRVFEDTLAGYSFSCSRSGELTIAEING